MYMNGRGLFSWEYPPPLEVIGQPELSYFPERLVLKKDLDSSYQARQRIAVYVPDIPSLRPDDEWGGHALTYLSVTDPDSHICLQVSWAGDWMKATKLFRGQPLACVCGDERWDVFFGRVGKLPILHDERCLVFMAWEGGPR